MAAPRLSQRPGRSLSQSAAGASSSQVRPLSAAFSVPLVDAPVVSMRDMRTLEIRRFLPLPRRPSEARTYRLDAYFYFPRSFGITPESWDPDSFYRDVNTLMRLHAPGARLSDLADLSNPQNPGALLRMKLPLLLTDDAPGAESLARLAQLYSAEVADAAASAGDVLREQVLQVARRAQSRGGDAPETLRELAELEELIGRTSADLLQVLGSVHRLRAKGAAFRAVEPPALPMALAFAEEYTSAVIDEQLAELATLIERLPSLRNGRGTVTRLRVRLGHVIEQVNRRRLDHGFATPWGDALEYFSYRIGLLKDELERALYINTRQLARDPFYRNSAAMVAAGLAATWATLAQIPMLSGDFSRDGQWMLLSFAVAAYVLKDRIKEWTRQLIAARFLSWDHDRRIIGETLDKVGFGVFTGRARERVRYVTEAQVPQPVTELRLTHRTVRGIATESEQVLHYRRQLSFSAGSRPVPEGFGVQDLVRLSLDEILKRLDDPVETVRFYDYQSGRFRKAEVPRVHHLNLVLSARDQARGLWTLSRTRVVVNQRGIVRLDPVVIRQLSDEADAPRPDGAEDPPSMSDPPRA